MSALCRERWLPTILGAVVAVGYLIFFREYRAPDSAKELLVAGISIGAIAVGFLANMKAVLFTIGRKRIIEQLKDAHYYSNLVDYLFWAIAASSFLVIICAVGIILDIKNYPIAYPVAVAIWIFAVVTAMGTYWRVISLFTRILRSD